MELVSRVQIQRRDVAGLDRRSPLSQVLVANLAEVSMRAAGHLTRPENLSGVILR